MSDKEHWKSTPDEHDYPAAHDYLTLVIPEAQVNELVKGLMNAPLTTRKAKDLLRAAAYRFFLTPTYMWPTTSQRSTRASSFRPCSWCEARRPGAPPLLVADGYHRICASYHLDEDADIPCRLVDRPAHG